MRGAAENLYRRRARSCSFAGGIYQCIASHRIASHRIASHRLFYALTLLATFAVFAPVANAQSTAVKVTITKPGPPNPDLEWPNPKSALWNNVECAATCHLQVTGMEPNKLFVITDGVCNLYCDGELIDVKPISRTLHTSDNAGKWAGSVALNGYKLLRDCHDYSCQADGTFTNQFGTGTGNASLAFKTGPFVAKVEPIVKPPVRGGN